MVATCDRYKAAHVAEALCRERALGNGPNIAQSVGHKESPPRVEAGGKGDP
jgi:hypothetical protein